MWQASDDNHTYWHLPTDKTFVNKTELGGRSVNNLQMTTLFCNPSENSDGSSYLKRPMINSSASSMALGAPEIWIFCLSGGPTWTILIVAPLISCMSLVVKNLRWQMIGSPHAYTNFFLRNTNLWIFSWKWMLFAWTVHNILLLWKIRENMWWARYICNEFIRYFHQFDSPILSTSSFFLSLPDEKKS